MKTTAFRAFSSRRGFQGGYSLLELIAVMAIMVIVAAAAISELASVMQASSITQGGQATAGIVDLARQLASARNANVQVRFIALAQVTTNPSATGFNAIQIWGTDSGNSNSIPLSTLTVLPNSVVVSQDPNVYSPLFPMTGPSAAGNQISSSSPYFSALSQMPVPYGTSAAYYAWFTVMPSGMLALSGTNAASSQATLMKSLYLTIVPARYGATSTPLSTTGAPSNYLIVQINPETCSTLVYRP